METGAEVTDGERTVTLSLTRHAGSRAFDVTTTLVGDGQLELSVVGAPHDNIADESGTQGQTLRTTVRPAHSGEVMVTAQTADGQVVARRRAMVLGAVDDRWGQPVAVPGLVNTPGWEDGLFASKDGRFLYVQSLPVPLDCVLGLNVNADVCQWAIGPMEAPARPGFPGRDRVAADGRISNHCPSVGLSFMPVPVPPNAVFGFERQTDGTYGAPFAMTIDDADGCFGAFGMTQLDTDPPRFLYAYDTGATDSGTGVDIFVLDAPLGEPVSLGSLSNAGGIALATDATALLAHEGQQGNPELVDTTDGTFVVYDDEASSHDLHAAPVAGDAADTGRIVDLPASINTDGHESQPHISHGHMVFTRDGTLMGTSYTGGALSDAASFGAVQPWITPEAALELGRITTVGEPSIATIDGVETLFFIAVVRRDGHHDLEAVMVPRRP